MSENSYTKCEGEVIRLLYYLPMERMSKIKTTYIYDDETDTAEIVELGEISCKKEKSLKASRDYWKERAETATKENVILKGKLENAYLELKIWSNGIADYMK